MKKYNIKGTRIVETSTSHVINDYATEEGAKKAAAFLNTGGAFNGWTPYFFLNFID
jgi:hypothetical protein